MTIKKEACVETLEESIYAEQNGADRIELCSDLTNDGLTPSHGLLISVFEKVEIPIRAMIRPRAGDFHYSKAEIETMKASILFCKKLGIEGVVFGLLKEDKTVDVENTRELAKLAQPLKVTFHKAIDVTPDIFEAMNTLSEIEEISAVLTSGQKATAMEGNEVLNQLVQEFGNKIDIISAGKITPHNLPDLQNLIKGEWYHGRKIVSN